MTMPSAGDGDHAYWRRPAPDATGAADASTGGDASTGHAGARPDPGEARSGEAQPPEYAGPPPTEPPPPGWRTPHVVRPAPPRTLPAQDLAGLDEAERSARTLTLGIGMIAGAIVLILSCLLCSRALF